MYRSNLLSDPLLTSGTRAATVNVGLVIPMHGSAGMFGLSCLACAVLAAEQINGDGGLLGREVRLLPVDGAGSAADVADRVERMVAAHQIDVVVGWHLSHVRRAIATRLAGRVPYVYSALYEGGERHPGVFLTGETPAHQIAPTLAWLLAEHGTRRWAVVADDYLWPHGSMAAVRTYAAALGMELVDEMFVPLGQRDYSAVLDRLRRGDAQGVLMLLVGQDAVHFNRAFAGDHLDEMMIRLSPLMDENMLLASGPWATRDVYSSAAYFESLATPDALELSGRYAARFGVDAPVLNSMGESCFEGLRLFSALVIQAQSLRTADLARAAAGPLGYQGPRGAVHLCDRHLVQDVYLARADGTVFDVLTRL